MVLTTMLETVFIDLAGDSVQLLLQILRWQLRCIRIKIRSIPVTGVDSSSGSRPSRTDAVSSRSTQTGVDAGFFW